MHVSISDETRMTDSQKLRSEAREFLDKAGATTDRTVRRLFLERALRLAQKAVMIEEEAEAVGVEIQGNPVSNDDSVLAAPQEGRRRA